MGVVNLRFARCGRLPPSCILDSRSCGRRRPCESTLRICNVLHVFKNILYPMAMAVLCVIITTTRTPLAWSRCLCICCAWKVNRLTCVENTQIATRGSVGSGLPEFQWSTRVLENSQPVRTSEKSSQIGQKLLSPLKKKLSNLSPSR